MHASKLTGLNGVEEICALSLLLDVRVDEKRICLRVDVLHHDLESIKAPRLRQLHLTHEIHREVLVDDPVARRKKRQHMRDKMPLAVIQPVPIGQVSAEVDLLRRPDRNSLSKASGD